MKKTLLFFAASYTAFSAVVPYIPAPSIDSGALVASGLFQDAQDERGNVKEMVERNLETNCRNINGYIRDLVVRGGLSGELDHKKLHVLGALFASYVPEGKRNFGDLIELGLDAALKTWDEETRSQRTTKLPIIDLWAKMQQRVSTPDCYTVSFTLQSTNLDQELLTGVFWQN